MIINDRNEELSRDYLKRLEEYVGRNICTRAALSRDIGISGITLNRFMAGERVKPCTLYKIGRFLEKNDC